MAVDLAVPASFSQLQLSKTAGSLARKRRFHIFKVQIWMEVSNESRTKALFSHLRLLDFEGGLARKLRFHIFNCGKASFSHLQLSGFEGRLARKLRFHICHFQILREISHESFVFTSSTVAEICFGAAISDAAAHSSIVFCNSFSADRIGMAASSLLGAATVCVMLLSFAAGHPKSYWSGCIKAAIVICQQIFSV